MTMQATDMHLIDRAKSVKGSGESDRINQVYSERRKHLQGKDTYSLFNPGHLYMIQQRQRAVLGMLRRQGFYPLADKRILEVGCGDGGVLKELWTYGASSRLLAGIDLLRWRMERAALENIISVAQADGRHIPYLNSSFDIVLQFTVFTSILDKNIQRAIASEMLRVMKPQGLILWYDYWLNPTNPDARGLRISDIRSLFPGCSISFRRVTLAPPVTRFLSKYSWVSCQILEGLKLLNTHYLVAIRPGGNQ